MLRIMVTIAVAVSLSLPSPASGAEFKIRLKDVAKDWLAAKGIKDASKDLHEIIRALEKEKKATTAIATFEKAILDGKRLDDEKHSLAVALNLLRLSDLSCDVVVPDYKEDGITAFTGTDAVVHKCGSLTSEVDLGTVPALRELGKVECQITEIAAKADNFQVVKGKPGTARLTLSVKITVSCGDSKTEHTRTLGPYRVTAWKDDEWSRLEKWK